MIISGYTYREALPPVYDEDGELAALDETPTLTFVRNGVPDPSVIPTLVTVSTGLYVVEAVVTGTAGQSVYCFATLLDSDPVVVVLPTRIIGDLASATSQQLIAAEIAEIKAKTINLPADPASETLLLALGIMLSGLPDSIDELLTEEHGSGPWVTGELQVAITPITSTVSPGEVSKSELIAYQHAPFSFTFAIVYSGVVPPTPINMAGHTLQFVVYKVIGTNLIELTTSNGVTISGASNNIVTVEGANTLTAQAGEYRFNVRDQTAGGVVRARGSFKIEAENKAA